MHRVLCNVDTWRNGSVTDLIKNIKMKPHESDVTLNVN